ncbi:hypothetical protein LTR17_006294 [Elasticomyces elasticus]|nr:hypothetical protein LTR17_006294 [Elasticomyces elasticus]
MPPPRKRVYINCHGDDCGHPDCSACDDSAIETAYADGEWRNVEQTRYQGQYVPGLPPRFQVPASPPWVETVWRSAVAALIDATVRQLLLDVTRASVPVQQAILTKQNEKKQTEQARVVDFSQYADEMDDIWDKYSSNTGSKEYENAFRATSEFADLIRNVRDEVSAHSSFRTKTAALAALCEIGDEVVDGPSGCLGSEVRKHFQYDTRIAEAMCRILARATGTQLARIKADSKVLRDVRSLKASAEGYGFSIWIYSRFWTC